MTLVAIRSFTDPTDGQPIEAGLTHVAESADVARMFPENFKKAPRLRSRLTRSQSTAPVKRPRRARTRPSWQLGEDEPTPYWRLQRWP
jgi:hypothetical protein